MKSIEIPIVTGPGSQPAERDGAEMEFMQLPSGMSTYSAPMVPEAEDTAGLEAALELTETLLGQLRSYRLGDDNAQLVLDELDDANREFFDQLLGEGEVSVQCNQPFHAVIQESVLAGVWRVRYLDTGDRVVHDVIEIGDIPALVKQDCFNDAETAFDPGGLEIPETVYNAAPLLTEIADKLTQFTPGDDVHVINLSLLPHTEEDLQFMSDQLGIGPIVVLSRGYGNCRISATNTRYVWWVQYFNSQETLILNTLEISPVPDVACASQEDITESAERLDEILSIYR